MFFLKSIPANLKYYRRSSWQLYLLDCLLISLSLVMSSLIRLEKHNLNQLKTQLNRFSSETLFTNNHLLKSLIKSNQTLLANYQLAFWLLICLTIGITLVVSYYQFNRYQADINTFLSANWSIFKINCYYLLSASLLLGLALLTVITVVFLFNDFYWEFIEFSNRFLAHQPLRNYQIKPERFKPLFKNHITDFTSDSLLNPILHDNAKQTLTTNTLWHLLPSIGSMLSTIFIAGQLYIYHLKHRQKKEVF